MGRCQINLASLARSGDNSISHLPDVTLVATRIGQLRQPGLGIGLAAPLLLRHNAGQCTVHVARHVFGIPANVQAAPALMQCCPHFFSLRCEAMLHVVLLGTVSRKGTAEAGEGATALERTQLVLVYEIVLGFAAPKEQHGLPKRLAPVFRSLPLLQEAAERREASARSNHDNRRLQRRGELKCRLAHPHWHLGPRGQAPEPGGGNAQVEAAGALALPHHAAGDVDRPRVRLGGAADAVKPRLHPFRHAAEESAQGRFGRGELLHGLQEGTPGRHRPCLEVRLALRRCQMPEPLSLCRVGGKCSQGPKSRSPHGRQHICMPRQGAPQRNRPWEGRAQLLGVAGGQRQGEHQVQRLPQSRRRRRHGLGAVLRHHRHVVTRVVLHL
mmetsp:Transcript_1269/g.3800  ORF Transcript_1269/g.3800 Transcript_1269/m.3800 type:complete len:384 (+) Transcript_1269:254-1405(+)